MAKKLEQSKLVYRRYRRMKILDWLIRILFDHFSNSTSTQSQLKPKWLGSPQERNMALAILAEPNELRAAVSKLVFVPFRVTISWVCCQKKEKHRLTNSRVELIRLGEYGERHTTLLRAPEPFRFWLRILAHIIPTLGE